MKKLLLIFTFFSFLAINAEAQKEGRSRMKMTPEKIAERLTERMAGELNLSDDQKEKIYSVQLERATKNLEEIEAQREKRKTAHLQAQKELETILTPEQISEWEAKKTELREERRQSREGKSKPHRERRRGVLNKGDIS